MTDILRAIAAMTPVGCGDFPHPRFQAVRPYRAAYLTTAAGATQVEFGFVDLAHCTIAWLTCHLWVPLCRLADPRALLDSTNHGEFHPLSALTTRTPSVRQEVLRMLAMTGWLQLPETPESTRITNRTTTGYTIKVRYSSPLKAQRMIGQHTVFAARGKDPYRKPINSGPFLPEHTASVPPQCRQCGRLGHVGHLCQEDSLAANPAGECLTCLPAGAHTTHRVDQLCPEASGYTLAPRFPQS